MKTDKKTIYNLINFSVLARELNKRGQDLNVKNFFPSRIGPKYQPVLDLLETKIQEFLNELDNMEMFGDK